MHWNLKCAQLLFLRLLPKVVIQMSGASYNIQITPHHWIFGHILVPAIINILLPDSGSLLTTSQGWKCFVWLFSCLADMDQKATRQKQQPTFYQLLDCDSVTFALQNFGRPVRTESRTSNGFNFCQISLSCIDQWWCDTWNISKRHT